MRLRLELFVDDLNASVAFYSQALGFQTVRRERKSVAMRRRLGIDRGAGVEIVPEVDDVDELAALHDHCRAQGAVVEALRARPWGLQDFRLADPPTSMPVMARPAGMGVFLLTDRPLT